MSLLDDLRERPWEFDLLGLLRVIERSHPDKPRIGDSGTRTEDYVAIGQDPWLEFPAATINRVDTDASGRMRLLVRFLGLLGPQGALSVQTTEEALHWDQAGYEAFPRFLDLVNHRFLQLYFRAWADARPIAQAERPKEDRFAAYVGSVIGLGTDTFRDRDTVSDNARLSFAGLLAPKARSASRLCQAVEGLLGIRCGVDEFVGAFLPFERADQTRLGAAHARLGVDCLVGASVYSVEDTICLRLYADSLDAYERFLPDGPLCTPLADLLFFYLGCEIDCEVELALPKHAVRPLALGRHGGGRLGYTTWLVPAPDPRATGYRCDARLNPAMRARRTTAPSAHVAERG